MLLPSSVLMVLAIASRKWVGVDSLGASTAVEGVPVLLGPVFLRTKENHIFPTPATFKNDLPQSLNRILFCVSVPRFRGQL